MRVSWLLLSFGCIEPEPGPIPTPTLTTPFTPGPKDTDTATVYTMTGFSFVDEHVAGMPQPGRVVPLEQDLAFLVEQELSLLVSLTETPTDPVAVEAVGLDMLHLPIVDFTPPTLEQQLAMVEEVWVRVGAQQKVGIHDTAGLGRCGTMLATWFVAKGMEAGEAIEAIRALRPGSIETDEQEQAVYDFAAAY
jgi:atypical dual specificity phosphatase